MKQDRLNATLLPGGSVTYDLLRVGKRLHKLVKERNILKSPIISSPRDREAGKPLSKHSPRAKFGSVENWRLFQEFLKIFFLL